MSYENNINNIGNPSPYELPPDASDAEKLAYFEAQGQLAEGQQNGEFSPAAYITWIDNGSSWFDSHGAIVYDPKT